MPRSPAAVQVVAATQNPTLSRHGRKRSEKALEPSMVLDIPYFADMQLNPSRYPTGKLILASPVTVIQ